MRLDFDTYKEILDTLTRNKSRSFLTGFGVFWGVFMLVGLIGGGSGLKEILSNNFEALPQILQSSLPNLPQSPMTVIVKGVNGIWIITMLKG